jgi:PKD repeat protein
MKRLIAFATIFMMVMMVFGSMPAADEAEETTDVAATAADGEVTAQADVDRGPLDELSRGQYHPEDFGAKHLYWLVNENISVQQRKLSDISKQSDPYHAGKNKADINLTRTLTDKMTFTYPNMHSLFSCKLNPSPAYDPPVLNFTINTLGTRDPDTGNGVGGAGKVIHFEIIIDTNGDYDPYNPNPNAYEGRIDFGTYTTIGKEHTESNGARQEEELVELTGTWTTDIPQQITGGRIHLQMWRTDIISDDQSDLTPDLLIYCGFSGKVSWLGLPYPHPMRHPHADANSDQGNITLGQEKIREYDNVEFNGTGSYDPQDDFGADGQADTGDQGEDNKNIDDGVPDGEPDLGEVDNLEYKWDYGVGAQSSGWQSSPFSSNKYHLPSEWKGTHPGEPYIFQAKLQVRDNDNLMDTDVVNITVYPYDEPPDIKVMEIRPDHFDDTGLNIGIPGDGDGDDTATVMMGDEVKFYAEAINNDPNEAIIYMWDLNGNGLFTVEGGEGASSTVYDTFTDDETLTIGLRVYDGPPDTLEATHTEAFLELIVTDPGDSLPPVPKLKASLPGGPLTEGTLMDVPLGETITLDASGSYDQDLIGGFDTTGDGFPDMELMFKYDLGNGMISEGADYPHQLTKEGYTFESTFAFNYTDPGNENQFTVTVYVHDGYKYDVATIDILINLRPEADAGPDQGLGWDRLQVGDMITFDSTDSFDPNDDTNGNGEIDSGEADNLVYTWDFGDGTTYTESLAMSSDGIDNDDDGTPDENMEAPDGMFDGIATHSYHKEATYTVKLTVEDAGELKDRDEAKIYIKAKNKAPRAILHALTNVEIFTGQEVQFSAEDSFDPDGKYFTDGNNKTSASLDLYWNNENERIYWDFGDGNTSETMLNYKLVQYKTFDMMGTYDVKITVADEFGLQTVSDIIPITVKNRLPRAVAGHNLTYESKASDLDARLVFLQGDDSWDPDGKVVAYKWSFGDGQRTEYVNRSDSTHTYDEYGDYTVILWVKDNNGGVSEPDTITVHVVEVKEGDAGDERVTGKQIQIAAAVAVAALLGVLGIAGYAMYIKRANEDLI